MGAASINRTNSEYLGKVRPSIFMQKWVCRLVLRVTGLRVERLRMIDETGATNEGIRPVKPDMWEEYLDSLEPRYPDYLNDQRYTISARDSFETLWNSINAERGYGWDANPLVWVIEFEIDKTRSSWFHAGMEAFKTRYNPKWYEVPEFGVMK